MPFVGIISLYALLVNLVDIAACLEWEDLVG